MVFKNSISTNFTNLYVISIVQKKRIHYFFFLDFNKAKL